MSNQHLEQNPRVRAYLDAVCAQVRCNEVHTEIRLELASHLGDSVERLLEAGASHDEAVDRALEQMGEPTIVGQELDRAHRPRVEWGLLISAALFVLLGFWAMYAVGTSPEWNGGGARLLRNKLTYTVTGLAVATGLYFLDYRRLWRHGWTLFGLAPIHGPHRVLVTPVMFAPALAALFSAWTWAERFAVLKSVLVVAAPAALYIWAGNMAAGVEYAVVAGGLLLLTRPPIRQLATLGGLALAGLGMFLLKIWATPFRMRRLEAWLHPESDPMGAGYQIMQSIKAITSAGPWGQGAFAELQFLPMIHASFIGTYLVYTLGWVAGLAICAAVFVLLSRFLLTAWRVRDRFGSLISLAIGASFAFRYGWNLLMVIGLAPIMGVALPFVSSDGLDQAINMAAIGLALGVFRRKDMSQNSVPARQ